MSEFFKYKIYYLIHKDVYPQSGLGAEFKEVICSEEIETEVNSFEEMSRIMADILMSGYRTNKDDYGKVFFIPAHKILHIELETYIKEDSNE